MAENFSIEAQELINTVLIEIYPEEALLFEKNQEIKEIYDLIPEMKLSKLKTIIQNQYQWALKYNFKSENADAIFWYRSEEKMEPRLGERNIDKGAEERSIMAMTGHKSTEMVRRYIKEANLFKNNALNKINI